MKPTVTQQMHYRIEINGQPFEVTPAQARALALASMQDCLVARERLQGALGERPPEVLVALEKLVRDHFGLRTGGDLRRKTRAVSVLWPRQLFCHMAHELFGIGWSDLARYLGGDHGTYLSAARRAADILSTEPKTKTDLRPLYVLVDALIKEQDRRRSPTQLIQAEAAC